MLFLTNRVLNEGPTPRNPDGSYGVPRPVSFSLRNNQAEQSIYFCYRKGPNDYLEIGNQAFFNTLKDSGYWQILLYLHGYSALPESAIFPRVAELQALFEQKMANGIIVIPLIWPCDDDIGAVKDYFDDQIAADASGIAYARLFEKFLNWRDDNSTVTDPCIKRINLLAHSMGNRVLRGALEHAVRYYQPQGLPMVFRNTFLAAADLNNQTLEPNQAGHHISITSRNVVVYYAADDLAMRASKVANGSVASRRLGQTGPANMDVLPRTVYALDCGDFNNDYDPPVGHGYFASAPQGGAGLVFDHMWQCIQTGRVPMTLPESRLQVLNRRFWES